MSIGHTFFPNCVCLCTTICFFGSKNQIVVRGWGTLIINKRRPKAHRPRFCKRLLRSVMIIHFLLKEEKAQQDDELSALKVLGIILFLFYLLSQTCCITSSLIVGRCLNSTLWLWFQNPPRGCGCCSQQLYCSGPYIFTQFLPNRP